MAHRTQSPTQFYMGCVALFLIAAFGSLALWAVIPRLALGWHSVVLTSGSMSPSLVGGDVVVASPHDGADLDWGTVVVFEDAARPGLVTHRIVQATPQGDYVTKGDGNSRIDSTPLSPDQVVGVGKLMVPLVGLPLLWWWQGQLGALTLTLVVFLGSVWISRWAFEDGPRPEPTRRRRGRTYPRTRGRHRAPSKQSLTPGLRSFSLLMCLLLIVSVVTLNPRASRASFSGLSSNSGNVFQAAPSFGGIAQVQVATAATSGTASAVTATYPSSPTEGNLLVAVHDRGGSLVTVPGGWTVAVERADLLIAYKVAGASESQTVTFNTTAPTHQTLSIFEYSGITGTSPLDQTASNESGRFGVTSLSTGTTPITSQADELVIAAVSTDGDPGGFLDTWTNSFVGQTQVQSTGFGAVSAHTTAELIVSATGQYETTESWNTSQTAAGVIATFKAAP